MILVEAQNRLVSYDQEWVSGSHWATAVTFFDTVSTSLRLSVPVFKLPSLSLRLLPSSLSP